MLLHHDCLCMACLRIRTRVFENQQCDCGEDMCDCVMCRILMRQLKNGERRKAILGLGHMNNTVNNEEIEWSAESGCIFLV